MQVTSCKSATGLRLHIPVATPHRTTMRLNTLHERGAEMPRYTDFSA